MSKEKKHKKKEAPAIRICSIGGEALMEGIMMRAPAGFSQVVRNPQGNLVVETKVQKPPKKTNF